MATKKKAAKVETVQITPPEFETIKLTIVGTSPLVIHNFPAKARAAMQATQEAGAAAKSKKVRESKDFEECFNEARLISTDGWDGLSALSIRNAMIASCRLVGFKMTVAKLAFFVEADGYSADGTPLIKITKGTPEMFIAPARNANGTMDLRSRPKWDPGWEAVVRIRYDANMFSRSDAVNLLARAGLQNGIHEGRPGSKSSSGMGWGLFTIKEGATDATR